MNTIYKENLQKFIDDNISITVDFLKKNNDFDDSSEKAWNNSLKALQNVLKECDLPKNINIILECPVPNANNKIDVVLIGDKILLIELKQWSDDNVEFYDGNSLTQLKIPNTKYKTSEHPAIQVFRYKSQIQMYNDSLTNEDIIPCVFLHNYNSEDIKCKNKFNYSDEVKIFLSQNNKYTLFVEFLNQLFSVGDSNDLVTDSLLHGKIKPNKKLADVLSNVIEGRNEFILDEVQLKVYNKVIASFHYPQRKFKGFIVEGGPGTGKSVIAIKLLSYFLSKGINAQYMTKTTAPREIYSSILKDTVIQYNTNQMFSNNLNARVIIVDESHRLLENHIRLLNSRKDDFFIIFFIDNNQKVTCNDIGSKEYLYNALGTKLHKKSEIILKNQFRCNSSTKYLNWLDDSLNISIHNDINFNSNDYDFQIFDNINLFYENVKSRNNNSTTSRIVAGYCWKWKSKSNADLYDIEIDSFKRKWNLLKYPNGSSSSWLIQDSFDEIGCIHSSQGLELDYIGVIIGEDLTYEGSKLTTNKYKNCELEKSNCQDIDIIIRNIYRVLMTRGTKGCYIYCINRNLSNFFKSRLKKINYQ